MCRRDDGYLWTANPCTDADGHLYAFLPDHCQLNLIAEDALFAISILGEREFTDDEALTALHRRCVRRCHGTGPGTVYCPSPTIPFGGSFEDSTITVGGLQEYMTQRRALRSRDSTVRGTFYTEGHDRPPPGPPAFL